jgi:hypothetical protein
VRDVVDRRDPLCGLAQAPGHVRGCAGDQYREETACYRAGPTVDKAEDEGDYAASADCHCQPEDIGKRAYAVAIPPQVDAIADPGQQPRYRVANGKHDGQQREVPCQVGHLRPAQEAAHAAALAR